jgi:type IV pilus assembly protein PilB
MTSQSKPVILCVDDSADWRALMEAILAEGGYETLSAATGREGLDRLRQAKPDLVFLDVGLPDMDGYAFCAELQKAPELSYLPVVFLTARDSDQDKARAFAAGGVDYLVKQDGEAAVLPAVRKHLRTRVHWKSLSRERRTPSADFAAFRDFVFDLLAIPPDDRRRFAEMGAARLYDLADALGLGHARMASHAAEFLKLSFFPHVRMDDVQLGVLPLAFCQANGVVALRRPDEGAGFVIANPFNWELIDELRRLPAEGGPRRIFVTEPAVLQKLFGTAPARAPEGAKRVPAGQAPEPPPKAAAPDARSLAEIEQELQGLYRPQDHVAEDADEKGDTAPVILLVERLIENAVQAGASDIHIEPAESEVIVRYRIDGDLREVLRLRPRRLINPIVSRIKIVSKLDIAERRLPQDGRILFREKIDLRVSTAPEHFGEKVVLRILDQEKAFVPLDRLGFSPRHLAAYREMIRTPYGLVLHVGPTGSGKTTTLFSALGEVKDPALSIQTVEDPIEYVMPGINQMQVRPDIGLTFHRALRAFLRQDPDVLLVGEIRDRETAEVAVEAALTGHLLLSTLHTNDATSTLTRFLEMGIEPFLVSSSIVGVCAQRLIRRLCTRCRQAVIPGGRERRLAGLPDGGDATLYRAAGCPDCDGTGYKGRVGVHELLVVDDAVRTALTAPGVTAERLKRIAVGRGMTTLYWDAMEKARAGLTSVEEVLAQVRVDDFDTRPDWMFEELGLSRPARPAVVTA